jgi:hypothetical protein
MQFQAVAFSDAAGYPDRASIQVGLIIADWTQAAKM